MSTKVGTNDVRHAAFSSFCAKITRSRCLAYSFGACVIKARWPASAETYASQRPLPTKVERIQSARMATKSAEESVSFCLQTVRSTATRLSVADADQAASRAVSANCKLNGDRAAEAGWW